MPVQHLLTTSPALQSGLRASLTAQIQTQAMSHAKFVFLIVLVTFFIVLFPAAYVWMRRPDFGQNGGRPSAPEGAVARADRSAATETGADGDAAPRDAGSDLL